MTPAFLVMGAIRFAMEIVAAVALGRWGWFAGDGGITGGVLMIVLPVIAFTFWGMFSVRDDPSRNPNPVVAVSDWVRLVIEVVVLGLGIAALWSTDGATPALIFAAVVIVSYAIGWRRIVWLVAQRP